MSTTRNLPKKRNPQLAPEKTPSHADLVSKRRLGRTDLQVKPSLVSTTNATKPENLGVFEYAHLRAPLPESLKSSEIFPPNPKQAQPESYFLMRRSSDGYISATGMFKVSFPWAKLAEEMAERDYVRGLSSTGNEEIAGNFWIPETQALEIADDYGIRSWIEALLDPSPVSSEDAAGKAISPPPMFKFTGGEGPTAVAQSARATTPSATGRGRGRPRASSPSKKDAKSPRKRVTKAQKDADTRSAREASASLQAALDTAAEAGESTADTAKTAESPATNGDITNKDSILARVFADEQANNDKPSDDKVTVSVESTVEVNGDIETTHTNVKVQMSADSPELPLPETTEEMIAKAKEMVEEARRLERGSSRPAGSSSSKRKAEQMLDDDDDDDEDDDEPEEGGSSRAMTQPAKRQRLLEQEVRKQKVRSRALLGVAATLAVGAIMPYFLGA